MIIYIGSDHAGFEAKNAVKEMLESAGREVTDLGCFSEDPCDYPDIAREVGEKVREIGKGDSSKARGLLFCGSGIGVCMAANRIQSVRAALVHNEKYAEMARRHNDANVLCFGGRENSVEEIKAMVDKFLTTDFEADAERHVRRVKKIDGLG